MPQLARAAQLAASTCQQLFVDRRWNCSSIDKAPSFDPDLTTGTREQAFVHALSSAAVTHALARACAQGALVHCSCAGPPRDPPNGNFKWGGCGDNVKHGSAFGRQFVDAAEKRPAGAAGAGAGAGRGPASHARRHYLPPPPTVTSSKRRKSVENADSDPPAAPPAGARTRRRIGRALLAPVNLHNNRAGRRAVESSEVTQCKCHGVSGSCNIKTCWKALPRLIDIGHRLLRRYAAATEVASRRPEPGVPNGRRRRLFPAAGAAAGSGVALSLRPYSHSHTPDDLIFLTKSPDYCVADRRTGSHGTYGRSCNATSSGQDSCQDMCCGRGFRTVTVERVERCHCKYYWCCYVRCKTCRTWVNVHECL